MPQIDEPTSPAPKAAPQSRKPKPATEKAPAAVYSFTVDTGSGRVITVERVDTNGVRHSLTTDETTQLAKVKQAMPLRRIVEQAFEAGIDYVLGDGAGKETAESKEEGELSAMLLQTLIEGSKAGELLKGDTLDRSVIDTLLGQLVKTASPTTD